jgi:hypothetical protein
LEDADGGILLHGVENDHGGGPAADFDEGEGFGHEASGVEKRITGNTEEKREHGGDGWVLKQDGKTNTEILAAPE